MGRVMPTAISRAVDTVFLMFDMEKPPKKINPKTTAALGKRFRYQVTQNTNQKAPRFRPWNGMEPSWLGYTLSIWLYAFWHMLCYSIDYPVVFVNQASPSFSLQRKRSKKKQCHKGLLKSISTIYLAYSFHVLLLYKRN